MGEWIYHEYEKENDEMGTCRTHEHIINAYKVLNGKCDGKRPLWRLGYVCE
jgi:hypothetical protein